MVNTIIQSNLWRKGLIWLTGYHPSSWVAKAGTGGRQYKSFLKFHHTFPKATCYRQDDLLVSSQVRVMIPKSMVAVRILAVILT